METTKNQLLEGFSLNFGQIKLRPINVPENLADLIQQNIEILEDNLEKWLKDFKKAGSIEAEILRDLSDLRKDLAPGSKALKLTPLRRIAIQKLTVAGFSLEDFKAVHRFKLAEWWETDLRKYCTPETLYREGNFPRYAEQASVPEFDELQAKVERMIRTNENAINLGL